MLRFEKLLPWSDATSSSALVKIGNVFWCMTIMANNPQDRIGKQATTRNFRERYVASKDIIQERWGTRVRCLTRARPESLFSGLETCLPKIWEIAYIVHISYIITLKEKKNQSLFAALRDRIKFLLFITYLKKIIGWIISYHNFFLLYVKICIVLKNSVGPYFIHIANVFLS